MKKTLFIIFLLVFISGILLFIFIDTGRESWDGNILIITLDTTRADCMGYSSNKSVKTPNIDRIAEEGLCFEKCYSPVPLTLPAHCTLFTGKYPIGHGNSIAAMAY